MEHVPENQNMEGHFRKQGQKESLTGGRKKPAQMALKKFSGSLEGWTPGVTKGVGGD